jgi:single-strand selective monofunctional uracil DNA glycosylase
MAQTGVPFGEVPSVRDWMGIHEPVDSPGHPHPKRPIEGFACPRSEVSGRRLWGLMQERFGSPQAFFRAHFVANYCPLVFMEESGRNRTPDKLPRKERDALFALCDTHLTETIRLLEPEILIGVGKFAEARLRHIGSGRRILSILHPSPASPAANRDWSGMVTRTLEDTGVW